MMQKNINEFIENNKQLEISKLEISMKNLLSLKKKQYKKSEEKIKNTRKRH